MFHKEKWDKLCKKQPLVAERCKELARLEIEMANSQSDYKTTVTEKQFAWNHRILLEKKIITIFVLALNGVVI